MLDEVGFLIRQRRLVSIPISSPAHAPTGSHRHGAVLQSPSLLVADEPTTALDVTVPQAQVLELLRRLRLDFRIVDYYKYPGMGVVGEMVDRVMVMYALAVSSNGR